MVCGGAMKRNDDSYFEERHRKACRALDRAFGVNMLAVMAYPIIGGGEAVMWVSIAALIFVLVQVMIAEE